MSSFMFCRSTSVNLFGCDRPLSNQSSEMFSLVCHSGMADFCFKLPLFSSTSLELDNSIHFPADFLLRFTPFCCYLFLFSFIPKTIFYNCPLLHFTEIKMYFIRKIFAIFSGNCLIIFFLGKNNN